MKTKCGIVPAPGVMPDGVIGKRGYRALCRVCGYLSNVVGYRQAQAYVTTHNKNECQHG